MSAHKHLQASRVLDRDKEVTGREKENNIFLNVGSLISLSCKLIFFFKKKANVKNASVTIPECKQSSAEPVYSPTMAGGLFAINRKFFERIGTYDSGFDIWGGENLELSFKVIHV